MFDTGRKPSIRECGCFPFLRSLPNAEYTSTDAAGDAILTAPGQVLEMEEVTIEGRQMRVWKNVSYIFGIEESQDKLTKAGSAHIPVFPPGLPREVSRPDND